MKVCSLTSNLPLFGIGDKASTPPKTTEKNALQNPVSTKGEQAKLVRLTFLGGLALGARLLFEFFDNGFVFDELADKAGKIVNKNHKNATSDMKAFFGIGAFVGLAAIFISSIALLYTIFKAPEIRYKGKVNAHKNQKDMDVYIKTNEVEKELYTQMNEKAKVANEPEKEKLQEQYLKLRAAKNQIPQFVQDIK